MKLDDTFFRCAVFSGAIIPPAKPVTPLKPIDPPLGWMTLAWLILLSGSLWAALAWLVTLVWWLL